MVERKSGNLISRKQSVRKSDSIFLAGTIAILILINIISQRLFYRIDLTSEHRYTLSKNTKEILRSLNDMVFIRIYLDGELNIPFKKFHESINDLLEEFRIYGRSKFQYEFVNPFENATQEMQNRIVEELYGKGLKPSNILQHDEEGGASEKIIFPGAIVMYNEIEIPINLLLNNPGLDGEENLNNSIEALEYSFISTIKNIANPKTEKIAFLEGHGELNEYDVNDFSAELSKSYQVDRGKISGMPGILDDYKAVIVAKPVAPFSEADKFVIDQYIMQGGKVLWLIDAVQVSLDSLINGETLAFIANLNLDDMFFRYGFRINPELIQDIQCNVIPVNMALEGNNPDFRPVPWLYFPLIQPNPNLPLTKNLNLVMCRFANPIDTIGARKSVKKTALLSASMMVRIKKAPSIVSLEEIKDTPRKEDFTSSNSLIGVLLEGEFESAFTNRTVDQYFDRKYTVTERSKPTKMAIVADGDIIRNDVMYSGNSPVVIPLGYDRFTRQSFGNKEFLFNLVQYLADDENLLELRGRQFKLRLLDKEKITTERKKWTILNMVVPSLIVLLLGGSYMYGRKRKFSR